MRLLGVRVLIGLASITMGCNERYNVKSEMEPTIISMDSVYKDFHYSDIFDDITYVVLHGLPEDEAVVYFPKILKFDEGYICWEKEQRALFIFGNDGKYMRHIKAIGGGPSEYVDIGDVCYNSVDKHIYLMDRSAYLIKYNLNGEGIWEIMLPKMANNIIADQEGQLLFYSNRRETDGIKDDCILWRLGSDNTAICVNLNQINLDPFYMTSELKFSRNQKDAEIFFQPPVSYNIYVINGEDLKTRYTINLGEKINRNLKDIAKMTYSERLDYFNGDDQVIYPRGHVFSSNDWIVTTFNVKKDIGLWNKPRQYHPREYILYNQDLGTYSYHNLIDGDGNYFSWRIRGVFENVLINHLYYSDVERIIEERIDLGTENGGRVLDQLDSTSEVLMLMKLKTTDLSS